MHAVNGRADLAGPRIDLGDFLPERREIRINGQDYLGWVVKDGHYPREVLARLGRAYRRYLTAIAALLAEPPVWLCVDCSVAQRKLTAAQRRKGESVVCTHTDFPEYEIFEREVAEDLLARRKAGEDQDIAYARYLTEAVLALVPNVLESEINLMPTETVELLLRQLGYFDPERDQPVTEKEGAENAGAPPLTGDSSLPVSLGSTESTQTTS